MPKTTSQLSTAERLAESERRLANVLRKVKVKENRDGKVIVEDGTGFVSGELAQGSMSAGGWRIDAPAGEGAQGLLFCPDGDPANGVFLPCLPDDANGAASTKTDTLKLISPSGKTFTVSEDGFAFEGDIKITGRLDVEGAGVTHNGKDIGDTHVHGNVVRGLDLTGVPA